MSENPNLTSSILTLTEKIYDDVAHPALSQLGKLVALPVVFLGYPAELLLEKYKVAMKKAIDKVPANKQIQATPSIAAPIIEHMKYAFEEEELLKVFINLLASCMDVDYSKLIHPSFVEKVKQMSTFDLRVLDFISNQLMFCYCELHVEVRLDEEELKIFPQIYLFTNMQVFDGDSQQVDKSIDLLISLGILEVDRKEIYRAEEYADRLVAFRDIGYESTYDSDLFNSYLETCNGNFEDEYKGTLYNHDRFFYGIELSPELENIILSKYDDGDDVEIETINSTRQIIKLTSYGKHFKKATFRKDD